MKKFYTDWEEFNDSNRCSAWVATAIIGSAVVGAGATAYAANKAAGAQTDAAQMAADTQTNMYNKTREDLAPFRNIGIAAADKLTANDYYTAPIDVTKDLQDPNSVAAKAYNFNLTQGNKAVANSAAARGLGVSGAALKGAANFTTGLVDNTYKTLFDMENTNRTNAYTRLKQLVDTGENASAQTGTAGSNAANQISGAQIGAGNAQAAADNKIGQSVGNFASNIGGYATYKGLYGGGSDVGSMPATGAGSPGDFTSNAYAISQGINPF